MYYKLTNKESKIYQDLAALRRKELEIDEQNKKTLKERFPDWNGGFYGSSSQRGFNRTTLYFGLCFNDHNSVNKKEWLYNKSNDCFIPYNRTKVGRELNTFLQSLPHVSLWKLTEILGVDLMGTFKIHFMDFGKDDIIILRLDDKYVLSEVFTEITSKEFKEHLDYIGRYKL